MYIKREDIYKMNGIYKEGGMYIKKENNMYKEEWYI